MPAAEIARVKKEIDALYRKESRRIFATLIRLLGDFDRAEEAVSDAFRAAMEKWPIEGLPQNPVAWLVSAGRFKSIDKQRRDKRFDHLEDRPDVAEAMSDGATPLDEQELLEDDRLRLVFTCCHPALAPDAQVALTLREVCGLTTEEIASAFLTPAPTLAQRIVRAKNKIRDANIPYEVPAREQLAERLESVLRVVYLVFNEGYSASSGDSATRADLSAEAIRLGRLILQLLPEAEVRGLLALMLLHESRRESRATEDGELILLDEQDRSRWDRALIDEGVSLVRAAFSAQEIGPYAVQSAIAAVHAEAPSAESTDWNEIVGLYDLLLRITPSPVIQLNRSVAVAMRDGPEAGLGDLDRLLAGGELDKYQLAHAARADFCRRLGRHAEARVSYERAIKLTAQGPARRFLEKRLAALPVVVG
ncbi:MAG TPA: RNA polymerase sigma factor [Steroidobacteraceae bacterium]|nr:RNA polymerase sigma factor [Steroidobacteraceae bacterium]